MIIKTIRFEDIKCETEKLFESKGKPIIITFDARVVEQFDKLVKLSINNYAKAKTFRYSFYMGD